MRMNVELQQLSACRCPRRRRRSARRPTSRGASGGTLRVARPRARVGPRPRSRRRRTQALRGMVRPDQHCRLPPRRRRAPRSTSRTPATTAWPAKGRCSSIKTSVSTTRCCRDYRSTRRKCRRVGGETIFASTRLAYQRLPDELKQRSQGCTRATSTTMATITAPSGFASRRPEGPDGHPPGGAPASDDGRATLVRQRIDDRLGGRARESGERGLFHELWSYLDDDAVRYEHRWEVGDLIVWDNSPCSMGDVTSL